MSEARIKGIKQTRGKYLLNITTGLGFFLMGYLMKNIQYRKGVFLLCGILYIALCIFFLSSVEMRHNLLERGQYLFWPITCLAGIVTINNGMRFLQLQSSNIMVGAGRHSMQLLVWHFPILLFIYTIYQLT